MQYQIPQEGRTIRRFATLDVLRGAAIVGMVFIHVLSRVYDYKWFGTDQMADRSLLLILFCFSLAYLGGMAGLFLMVSTISNTISMKRQLQDGKSLGKVMKNKLLAGVILLVFAFLVEAVLGPNGFLGKTLSWDPGSGTGFIENSRSMLPLLYWRGYHFMTLHMIAWALIINTLVMGILSVNGGYRKVSRNVKVYICLIILVILLTPMAWKLTDLIVPGYPFATYAGTDHMVQYPLWGTSSAIDHVVLFFLGPLGGQTEPLFPFLAVAFIGSIIGLGLTRDRPSPEVANKGIKMGLVMFVLGGLWIPLMYHLGLDSFSNLVDNTFIILKLPIWLPILLLITGGNLLIVSLCLRLVEFRGKAKAFARRMTFFRRFGIVSLTVFTFQYFDMLPRYILTIIPGMDVVGGRVSMPLSFLTIGVVLISWDMVLRLWKKVDYRGSVEWTMGVMIRKITKLRSQDLPWHALPKLRIMSDVRNVEWIELEPVKRPRIYDSRLSFILSIFGLFFFPLSFISLRLSRYARKIEGINNYNRMALKLSWAGIIFFCSWAMAFSQIKGIVLK
jgi:hypothetical protein